MRFFIILLMGISLTVQAREPVVKKTWEVNGLKQPESVIYDKAAHVFYVSNINGSPMAKDNNGFISKIDDNQKIVSLTWVKGLSAPKGLALFQGKLYVADIDALVEIDVASAKITGKFVAPGAKFLNDVVADNGAVYVSDMLTNTIHKLENGKLTVWLQNAALENPNGLFIKGNILYVGTWGVMTNGFATKVPGKMLAINLNTKEIKPLGNGESIGNLDGVEADSHGSFFVTDWMNGNLLHVSKDGEAQILSKLNAGSADLTYVKNKKLLAIPMMNDGVLAGYTID
ncbi:hypothetical protein K1X76_01000 [bacterium]|nr:hypothetical protein [bacterium]